MNPPTCYMEISQDSIHALYGEARLELPLERQPNGRLTPACKDKLTAALQGFLKRKLWQLRLRVWCGIGARGVSLRQMSLPASTKENLHRVLLLQIESEFPLSPNELAWGHCPMGNGAVTASPSGKQELMVIAAKRDVLEEYVEILGVCGATPVFTLAGWARHQLCSLASGECAMMDVGADQTELMMVNNGVPSFVRILPWGGDNIIQALTKNLGISREEAVKITSTQEPPANGDANPNVQQAMRESVDALAGTMNGYWTGQKIYVTGHGAGHRDFARQLTTRLGNGTQCESLEPVAGRSATIEGLKAAIEKDVHPPLILQVKPTRGAETRTQNTPLKWAALAAGLLVLLLSSPYIEALLFKPWLASKMAAMQADKARLPIIDRELSFLQNLKQNQPPYIDALYLVGKSTPPGTRMDSVSMNRRGDFSLRFSMRDSQQVADFRAKLLATGFYTNVVVEEQTPTPDRQKMIVRMSAQWKSAAARQALNLGPTPQEIEKSKASAKEPMAIPQPSLQPVPQRGSEMISPPPLPSTGTPPPTIRISPSRREIKE